MTAPAPPQATSPIVAPRSLAAAFWFVVATMVVATMESPAQRGRQHQTAGDLRTLATALESYSLDHGDTYPITGGAVDAADVAHLLEPTYVTAAPLVDAWGTPYRIESRAREYTVLSFARDRRQDPPGAEAAHATSFDADIVLANGSFVRFPDGYQQ